MRVKYLKGILAATAVGLLSAGLAMAADTGTVSGLVTDQNGQPVSGALVVVTGANRFATSNPDGYYVISPVPVGSFEVKASRIGFNEQVKTGVKVIAGLRSNVSFQLQSEATGVTYIQSEEPLIKFNQVYSESIVGKEQIENQVVDEFADMLVRTPGIVYENSDASTLNLHIRGGRGNEVAYVVDGVNITNPIVGGAGMQIPVDAIEQMNIIVAGWDAEFGQAQSGIINIQTKEGRDKYTGKIGATQELYTAERKWDSQKKLESTGLESPGSPLITWETETRQTYYSKYRGSFGGPAWPGVDQLSYFVAGDYTRDWTVYPLPEPRLEWNANGKISIRPTGRLRLVLSGGRAREERQLFSNEYQYNLQGYPFRTAASRRLSASFTHNVSDRFYYSVTGATFNENRSTITGGKHWLDYNLNRLKSDATGYFVTSGDYPLYELRDQTYYDGKADFQYELTRVGDNRALSMNVVKGGVGLKNQDVDFYQIQAYPSNVYTDIFHVYPYEIYGFVQDKLEYSGMVINVGLRLDIFDPSATFPVDPYDFQWGHNNSPITGEEWVRVNNNSPWRTYADMPRTQAEKTYQISPRVGVSYPISDRDKLTFSYGHFFQVPPLIYLYRSTQVQLTGAYPIMGNPDLLPQKTVQYEIGVEHLFTDDLKAKVSAYFKDIRDLIDTNRINYEQGWNYTKIVNADFGSVRGMELALDKRMTRNFSGSLGYTFSVAKGLASNYYQGYNYAYRGWNVPNRENLLNWDQTHKVDLTVDYRFTLAEIHGLGVNSTLSYGSGMPYSKPPMGTGQPEINAERMPWTIDWNVKGEYSLTYWGLTYTAYCEVINLLNRENVYNFGEDEGDGAGSDWLPWYYFYGDADGPYDDMECYGDPLRVRVGLDIGF
ncbi:MAG: TonB-dependent receptor [Candidatus Coatesbacteria bacterium]|nr:MAG: TonB-dependent receptor [Candidatus Coatesbacteria bacterium]